MHRRTSASATFILVMAAAPIWAEQLQPIRVSESGDHFVLGQTNRPFVVWGVNYDHDRDGRLLDEYWIDEWDTVEQDFAEIKQLGANCVRVHLQLGKFMHDAQTPNAAAVSQLKKLVKLAEQSGLYLDITGLACYHKANIPPWYDPLDEQQRWAVQARFWEAVAKACSGEPAVFCYDLMNEPIIAGKEPTDEWLAGPLGDKYFVQRITLDRRGREPQEIAQKWVEQMVAAIRRHDKEHLVTVGVIPWVFAFGGGKPLFYAPDVAEPLDFVSVHFYPERGKVDAALKALKAYDIGKPLVVEEIFPLKADHDEVELFIRRSSTHTDGWISFYWGARAEELRKEGSLSAAITAAWLERFSKLSKEAKTGRLGEP
ncbi:cellulase family glycosylhydrolase [Aeoliella sp.]|uniref:cellulase family glycosylhydrolase n=1 Tax=Aeoliella sp. TaxID=2795800 RepID=UPI003CCBE236